MNCLVPAYIINVLTACGYDSSISKSSIEDDDVRYLEEQVRNGNVSKCYDRMGAINILDGSTKSESNFEFSRGHRKFLIFISNFMKNNSKEIASNPVELSIEKPSEHNQKFIAVPPGSQEPSGYLKSIRQTVMNQDKNLHQGVLTCKIIMSIIHTIPVMYAHCKKELSEKEMRYIDSHDKIFINCRI